MTPHPKLLRSWRRALPYIEEALAHGGGSHSIEDVFRQVMTGQCHLWLGERSAAVTEWVRRPQKTELNIWLAGGDLSEMREVEAGMMAFARGGCADNLACLARPTSEKQRNAWSRGTGFILEFLAMKKDLW